MRKYQLAANAILHLPILMILGLAVATAWPLNFMIVAFIYMCGIIDLAYAKLPQIRQGVINSFGPALIPVQRHSAYYRAYCRLAFGFGLHCLVLVHYYSVVSP